MVLCIAGAIPLVLAGVLEANEFVASFLAWRFIGKAWHISWVVWPVAGVLFGAIACAVRLMRKK